MAPPAATPSLSSIALHKLPVQLRMLVRLAGEAAAYRLVEHHGGTPWTCPKALHSPTGLALIELVGAPGAAVLVHELGGTTLQLPKNDAVLRQLRHQRVLELRSQGAKLGSVARATGYTVRHVINVCQRAGLDVLEPGVTGQQHDLFADLAQDGPEAAPMAPPPIAAPHAPASAAGPASACAPSAHNPFGLGGRPAAPNTPAKPLNTV